MSRSALNSVKPLSLTTVGVSEAPPLKPWEAVAFQKERLQPWLKIGAVARQSGLPVKTIRYYEEIGLLTPTTTRSAVGYRLFGPQVLNRVAFIKRAQSLGLSLSEIQEILAVYDSGQLPCGALKQHLLHKVEAIAKQIAALELLNLELQGLLSGWQERPPRDPLQTICPNIQPSSG